MTSSFIRFPSVVSELRSKTKIQKKALRAVTYIRFKSFASASAEEADTAAA